VLNTLRTRRPLKPNEGDEILEEPHSPHPVRNIVNLLRGICTTPKGYFLIIFRQFTLTLGLSPHLDTLTVGLDRPSAVEFKDE